MLSGLARLPYKMLLESGDCTNSRFAPDFAKNFVSKQIILTEGDLREEPLHPINKWLTWIDPEMWEVSSDGSLNKDQPRVFPKYFMSRLIHYLTPADMKSSRLVCQQWNNMIITSSTWTKQLVAVIDVDKAPWLDELSGGIGSTCASYLETSSKRFSYWSEMRLRQLRSRHLYPLLTFHASAFRRSVKNVETLEIQECHFIWTDFLELIHLFRNLKTLHIHKCHFKFQDCISDDILVSLGLKRCPEFQEILEQVNQKCSPDDYLFGNLKYLSILEDDRQSEMMTPLLLSLLQVRTKQMETFELQLGRTTSFMKGSSEQTQLWKAVHSFLASKNVTKVDICSRHNVSSGLVNRCFVFMNLWKFPPGDEIWRLQKLTINLRPLALWSSFDRHLIPLLQRLPELKLLCIRNIVLRGRKVHFVEQVKENCPSDCQLQIGLILDDQGGSVASSTLEKEMLSSDLYQRHLIAIEVIIHTDSTREIRDLVPYRKKVTFPTVHEFVVSTNSSCRPRFFNFNVNMIVHNFPNLSELRIVDGPSFQYHSIFKNYTIDTQWQDMSGAVFGDEDMQLILRTLTSLKKLVLRANMKYMTDTGFTGVSGQYCRRLLLRKNIWNVNGIPNIPSIELMHRDGVSFSNLTHLEYVCIEGVGSNVTDITAMLAFSGLLSLQFIGLYGSHLISLRGKEYLQQMLSETSQLAVVIT